MKRSFKRILATVLTVFMVMTAIPLSGIADFDWSNLFTVKASAEDYLAPTGQCGENVYWTFDEETGELVISGTGRMYEYEYLTDYDEPRFDDDFEYYTPSNPEGNIIFSETPFYGINSISRVIIGEGVTDIRSYTFCYCSNLYSISISGTVSNIEAYAFWANSNIQNISVASNNQTYFSETYYNAIIEKNTRKLILGCENTNLDSRINSIGEGAFSYCANLSSIRIPNSVTSIGESAFEGCDCLSSVNITEEGLTEIGNRAFKNCKNLKSMTSHYGEQLIIIPMSVESIGVEAFYGCSSMNSVAIRPHKKKTSIGNGAFLECSSLTSVTMFDGITSIGKSAFSFCESLTSIDIPDSVTKIDRWAFEECSSLTSMILGNQLDEISIKNAVMGCDGLQSLTVDEYNEVFDSRDNCNAVIETKSNRLICGCKGTVIPDSVTSIGDEAFDSCYGLTSITIPDSVTSIGNQAFYFCENLTSITIPDSVTSLGDGVFEDCRSLSSITIPDSVTSIGDGVFEDCRSLSSITIPDSVTSIDSWAFKGCSSLQDVYYNGTQAQWNELRENIGHLNEDLLNATIHFIETDKCGENVTYIFDTSTGLLTISGTGDMFNFGGEHHSPFYRNLSIQSVVIENGVTGIGTDAFLGCENLADVTIPVSVTKICEYAFWYCTSLTSITIPDTVISIGDYAFADCSSLESAVIGNGVTDIGNGVFEYCSSLADITIGNSVTSINASAFSNTAYYADPGNWENGVLYIGNWLIKANRNNVSGNYTIKEGTKGIVGGAFEQCDNLTGIVLPNSVTSIGTGAFEDCTRLTNIEIPDSVTFIGKEAFLSCYRLTSISISDGLTSISEGTFTNCPGLTSVTIPDSVTSIGEEAFFGCTGLENITLSNSLESIGESAFAFCNLGEVYLPETVESIGYGAFALNGETDNMESFAEYYFETHRDEFEDYDGYTDEEIIEMLKGELDFIDMMTLAELILEGELDADAAQFLKSSIHVTVDNNNPYICCDNYGVIYTKDMSTLVGATGNLRQYEIPDGVRAVEYGAFINNITLTDITIPDSVTSIGEGAFAYCCSLTNVTIGSGVESISDYAFEECIRLSDIYFSGTQEQWQSLGCETDSSITLHFLPDHEHTFGSWYVAVEPTTTVCGVIRRECKFCDYYEEMEMGFAETDKVKGITLSSHTESLIPGDTVTLTAVIDPETAGNKNVIWSSSDETVASVSGGTVTAEGVGSAVIIAETEEGGYKDFCLVKVVGITASVNTNTVIDSENGLIYGLAPNLDSIDDFIEVADDGLTLECDSEKLGTGSIVNIIDNGIVVDSYEIVIIGDANGDSWYDGTDSVIVNCLANGLLSKEQVGEAVYMAADCNHDGVIDSADVALLEQAGLILASVDQSKSADELMTDSVFAEYLSLIDQNPIEETPVEKTATDASQAGEQSAGTSTVSDNVESETKDNQSIFQKIIAFITYIFRMIISFIPKAV